ncbi:cellulase family glycosylhydrolase [Microbacterium sp. 18062]|uniref:cellulase family glycosylhydrolase n=1 Tax=Microbacterium sp. 18062 TaxID=2681410 RepID=UPI00135AD362|nr:cellulase family glycosylhydrolase [Microbacterium sp. 18062]
MIRSSRALTRIGAALVAVLLTALIGVLVPNRADAAAPGWLHTSGGDIVTADGTPYTIKAVSWFGLETSNCAPHGLWTIPLDEGLRQIAAMGFTTVRLPYSNECLAASASTSIDANVNPDLVGLSPLELLDAVVSRADAAGLTVILDRHRPDSAAQSALWYTDRYSEEAWIADWRMLAERYRDDPTVIGVDLHNEPHGEACWGCGDPARDWRAAATRAGDAVLAVNPRLLIIVEGVERQPDGSSTWWGGGLAGVAASPVELAVPDRVVYSPHDYPASVYAQPWFADPAYPANLEERWERDWGYIATEGIAPVLLGEFGTTYLSESDRQWLASLVSYLERTGISFAYWSFNPNSGDTGGLVADDWRTPEQDKLDALRPILEPVPPAPTAVPSPTSTPSPSRPATPGPSRTPEPTPVPEPSAPAPSGDTAAEWILQSAWGEGYVAEFVVTAGAAPARSWTISWVSPGATEVVNSWGMDCTVVESRITCTGAGWATTLAAGQSVRAGLQVSAPSAPSAPQIEVRSSS